MSSPSRRESGTPVADAGPGEAVRTVTVPVAKAPIGTRPPVRRQHAPPRTTVGRSNSGHQTQSYLGPNRRPRRHPDILTVVPRGHGTVPLQAVDAAFDRVPSLVILRVELRRMAAAGAEVRTRLGRVRGLPGPWRGHLMRPRTISNCGESPRCPVVITMDIASARGRDRPARWRRRRAVPSASPPFPRPGGVLVGPADGGIDVDLPGDQVLRIRLGLELDEDVLPGSVALPAAEQVVHPPHGPYSSGMSRHGMLLALR